MLEIGDALLFALSASRRWSWNSFKSAFDEMHLRQAPLPESDRPDSFSRWHAAALLDALAHCDFASDDGLRQLVSAPAVLASLPVAGLPRAILCGARSPETLSALRRQAGLFGGAVRVTSTSQASLRYYAPARIEVGSDDTDDIERFAGALGIAFARVPPAWILAVHSGDLAGYLDRLIWSDDPELGWPRQDFDPLTLRFAPAGSAFERLSRYQDPTRGTWMYRLVRNGSSARVDASWGRWAAVHSSSRLTLDYDSGRGILTVPATMPLPRLIARALVLCAGWVPRLARAAPSEAQSHELASTTTETWVELYEGVPSDVYELIATKIGQPVSVRGEGELR